MKLTHYFTHVLYLSGSQLAEIDRRLFVRCAGKRSYVQKKSLYTVKNTMPKISPNLFFDYKHGGLSAWQ
jgi:hypothetical protein